MVKIYCLLLFETNFGQQLRNMGKVVVGPDTAGTYKVALMAAISHLACMVFLLKFTGIYGTYQQTFRKHILSVILNLP